MTVHISQLIYVPEAGKDVAFNTPIAFDPEAYRTHEEAARALREALIDYAVTTEGFSRPLAESEISVWAPARTKQYSGCEQWCVVWESGPYQWAVSLSMQLRGPWGFCEPYYSFDLHFTD
jgi:hypothetical protein